MAASLAAGALVLAASGCAGEEPIEGDEAGEDDPPGPPQWFGPEGESLPDVMILSADRTRDLSFMVADLRPNTHIELDGEASLPGPGAPAWLDPDPEAAQLHVPLGGALVVGRHELALVHQVGSELLRSNPLALELEASSPGVLTASLGDEAIAAGDRLVGEGQGGDAPLGIFDGASGSLRAWAGAWGAASVELELAGVGEFAELGAPATWAALGLGIAAGPEARWLVVTWLDEAREHAYVRVAAVTGPGELVGEPGPALELWSLDDPDALAQLGPHEYASLRAVAVLDRTAVIGVEARRDLEQPSPGDRLLVTRFATALDELGAPILVRGADGADLDLLGDARRWTGRELDPRLGLRVDRAFAAELDVAANGLPRVEQLAFAAADRIPAGAVWMRSADAALGSRHVFALDQGADGDRVHVIRDLRSFSAPDHEGEGDGAGELPGGTAVVELPAPPSAAPSLAALAGVPILLVPQGPDAEVLALRSTGAEILVEPVADLRCDAARLSPPSADGVADTLPLACLRAGELFLGALSAD